MGPASQPVTASRSPLLVAYKRPDSSKEGTRIGAHQVMPLGPSALWWAGDLVAVNTDEVTTERHREAGSVHVGYQFWKRLGLDDILSEAGLTAKSGFAVAGWSSPSRSVRPSAG